MTNCYNVIRLVIILTVTVGVLGGCGLFTDDETRVAKAKKDMASGDHRTAVVELKKVLQNNANNKDARLLLGEVLFTTGDVGAAEKELRRAQELGAPPDDYLVPLGKTLLLRGSYQLLLDEISSDFAEDMEVKVHILVLRGNAHLGLGSLAEAQQSFNRALELQGTFPGGLIGLARIAQTKGDSSTAEAYLVNAASENPDHVAVWIANGQFEFGRKAYAQAEAAFTHAVELLRATAFEAFAARSGLIEAQLAQGKSDEALANVEILLKAAPRHPHANYLRARVAYGAKDYNTTAEYLQKVLGVIPDHRPSQLLLGTVNYEQGNFDQAEMYVSSLVAADPSNTTARKLLAEVRLRLDRPEEALAALTPALQQDTDNPQLLAMVSRAAFQAGDLDVGVTTLEEASKADPNDQALQWQLAAGYLSAGKIEQAIATLERLPETKEGPYRRELLLVLAHLRKNDTKSAIVEARKLVVTRPNDSTAQNLIGGVYIASGQKKNARKSFDKALALDPKNTAALLNLGRLDFVQAQYERAAASFDRILAISPKHVSAMVALAQVAAAQRDEPQVLKWLEQARAVNERAVTPRLLLTRYYLARGNLDQAQQVATEAQKAAPQRADVLNVLGTTQLARSENREALTSFRGALKTAPKVAEYQYNLARAQFALRNLGSAREALVKALELKPDHMAATFALARLEISEGNSKQAFALATKLKQRYPKNTAGYSLEGDLYVAEGKYSEALQAYDAAFKISETQSLVIKSHRARLRTNDPDTVKALQGWLSKHPDDSGVRLLLAQVYQQSNRQTAAVKQYEMIRETNPENAVALNNLAWLYHQKKDARALQVAEQAHRLQPKVGTITDTFGWLLVQEGKLQRGVELLRKATQQAPNVAEIQYHLAVALARSGANGEARKTLTELLNSGDAFTDRAKAQRLLSEL